MIQLNTSKDFISFIFSFYFGEKGSGKIFLVGKPTRRWETGYWRNVVKVVPIISLRKSGKFSEISTKKLRHLGKSRDTF
jgi:hypothetical protein